MVKPLWKGFTYYRHQIEGIKWMIEKETTRTYVAGTSAKNGCYVYGGLQCDEMGLGKTIQIAATIINNILPDTLLVAPLAMIETWKDIMARCGCAVYDVGDMSEWEFTNASDPVPMKFMKMRPKIYISNYEKLFRKESLFSRKFDRIVLDEAHKIRNGDGTISKACRRIKASVRWAVTGTPLVNKLSDVVALLAFIGVPYSPLWRWEARYVHMLPDLVIHRSLDSIRSVIPDAPPVPNVHNLVVPFTTKEEKNFYLGIQGATKSLMKRYASDVLTSQQAFVLLMRLRQISTHPQVYINAKRRESTSYTRGDWEGASTKLEKIKELISSDKGKRSDGAPHKYIIFCQFNDEMDIIREYLIDEGVVDDIYCYNGSMGKKEREESLRLSKECENKCVLLIQLQAGGVGLNIQYCDRIIFVSPWWTSAMIEQAVARAVRMGQTEVVRVYHLQLEIEHENSINIDKLINAKAEEKKKLLEKIFSMCATGADTLKEE